ncbi:hypothetical protein [Wukongibacter baidiensis]
MVIVPIFIPDALEIARFKELKQLTPILALIVRLIPKPVIQ